jgi:hypothetical protein
MKKGIIALLAVMLLFNCTISTDWHSFFGTHYASNAWEGTIRTHNYGLTLDGSGRIVQLDSSKKGALGDLLVDSDVVLLIGGLGSLKNLDAITSYTSMIELGGGASWELAVTEYINSVSALNVNNKNIYIQLGNEISSDEAGIAMHAWMQDDVVGKSYDRGAIPAYVEYFLAPTVAGINNANSTPKILLGSITNFRNTDAIPYMEALLNYKIVGTYAPSLAGKYVHEVIDIVSAHYFLDSAEWETQLNYVNANWIVPGKIEGLFSTEEVGIKAAEVGSGAVSALYTFSRYSKWWQLNGFSPSMGRAIFWGASIGPLGTRADDVMQEIYNFIGTANLAYSSYTLPIVSEYEVYRFTSLSNTTNSVITILTDNTISLGEFTLKASVLPVSAEAIVYTNGTSIAYTMTTELTGLKGEVRYRFPETLMLTDKSAILIKIQQ